MVETEVRHQIPSPLKLAAAALVVLAAMFSPPLEQRAPASPIVKSFGDSGRVVTNMGTFGAIDEVSRVEIDSSGRTLVAGYENYIPDAFRIARLLPDGTLDESFGDDGLIAPGTGRAFDLAADGSIYVPGSLGRGTPRTDMAVRRYLPDGQVDRSFGKRGTVRTDMGISDRAGSVFVQPGGRLVVFGQGNCHGADDFCGYTYSRAYAVRYTPDGKELKRAILPAESLSSISMTGSGGFAASGLTFENEIGKIVRLDNRLEVTKDISFEGSYMPGDIAVQGSGRILTPGDNLELLRLGSDDRTPDPSFDGSIPACPGSFSSSLVRSVEVLVDGRIMTAGDCGMARLDAEGVLDPTFADAGALLFEQGMHRTVTGFRGDGEIAVGNPGPTAGEMLVRRFDTGGQSISAFGEDGVAHVPTTAPTPDRADAITVDARGRLIAGGYSSCRGQPCGGFALARYKRDGSLDPAFGNDGRVVTSDRRIAAIEALADYPNGSIIAAGTGLDSRPTESEDAFALAKYLPSGELDPAFGDDGVVITQASTRQRDRSELYAVALQPNRKIVVAGFAGGCGRRLCFTVARYTSGGQLDTGFADEGIYRFRTPAVAGGLAIQPDGRIVVTGGNSRKFITLRLKPNGSLDRSFSRDGAAYASHRIKIGSVTDLSQQANAVVVGANGRITIGGGGASGRGKLYRYMPNGTRDRSFGKRGRVKIPSLNVTDLSLAKCGLFALGARKGRNGNSIGLVAIRGSRAGKGVKKRMRLPFGASYNSFAGELAPTDGRGSIVLAGGFARSERADDFALAKFKTHKLLRGCRG